MTEVTFDVEEGSSYKDRFTRYEDETGGNERVIRAHEWARGYAWCRAGVEIDSMVEGAHDHKGGLTVTWTQMPTDALMRAYDLAWAISGMENSDMVEHHLAAYRVRIARNK